MSEVADPGALRDIAEPSWRRHIVVHPAVDLFPPMSDAELLQLGEDIKTHGLRAPVIFLDNRKTLIDGRNRLDAIERAGLPILDARGECEVLSETVSGVDPFLYVVSVNLRRRHLTAEQRDDVIRRIKAERPRLSIRGIAAATHSPRSTVARALTEPAVPSGTPERVTGRDGKSYPAKAPSIRKAKPAPAQARSKSIVGFSTLLRQQLRNTLEDLVRI